MTDEGVKIFTRTDPPKHKRLTKKDHNKFKNINREDGKLPNLATMRYKM